MHNALHILLKSSRYGLIFSIFCCSIPSSQAQNIVQKLKNKFLSNEKDSTRSSSFMILPALGYAQETGLEYGIASTYNFYADKKDPLIRTSTLTLMGTLTTEKQANIKLNSDIWTAENKYHILSEIRYRNWPFNYYGIGSDTYVKNEDYIDQHLFRFRLEVEKKIKPNFYIGVNSNYEYFKFRDVEEDGIFNQDPISGKTGGQHLLLGVSTLYDTRNNVSYTTAGHYARLKYAYAPKFWKAENFEGSQLDVDLRTFKPISPTLAIGIQAIHRSTFGASTPFYSYRELGGDMMMRGYYTGRYRDKNYSAAQAELRFRVHPRIGLTAFGAAGSVYAKEHSFRLLPSYGAGLRYFFSLEHNSSIRFDYAYGEKRAGEQRQSGFYLSLSEAF